MDSNKIVKDFCDVSEIEKNLINIEKIFDFIFLDACFHSACNENNLFDAIRRPLNQIDESILHYQYEKFSLFISHIIPKPKYIMPLFIIREFKKGYDIFSYWLQRHKSLIGKKKKLRRKYTGVINRIYKLKKPLEDLISVLEERAREDRKVLLNYVLDKSKSFNDNLLVNLALEFYLEGYNVAILSNDKDITFLSEKFFKRYRDFLIFSERFSIFYFDCKENLIEVCLSDKYRKNVEILSIA